MVFQRPTQQQCFKGATQVVGILTVIFGVVYMVFLLAFIWNSPHLKGSKETEDFAIWLTLAVIFSFILTSTLGVLLFLAAKNKKIAWSSPWMGGSFFLWLFSIAMWGYSSFAVTKYTFIAILAPISLAIVVKFRTDVHREDKKAESMRTGNDKEEQKMTATA